ncbi:MAG TPA: amidohydrolase family protein [Clostridiaceae bacterium]|nr:amidohydrolase family protein [Clostridiaceae bacterium]
MIIDFHTHCFTDELASSAIPVLAQKANIPAFANGTVSALKESMKKYNITFSVVLNIATKPSQTETINNWAAEIQKDSIIAFGSIHPKYKNWENELMRIKGLGLKGIKFHPEYQAFYVDDEAMYPIYEKAFELGLIVVFHAGVDLGYKPPVHCTPDRLDKLVRNFKGGTLVAAHMGGFRYWDDVEKYLVGKDIYFDTSFCLGYMTKEQKQRIIQSHGYKKIVFGSDSPWKNQGEEVQRIKALCLEKDAEEAILYNNAAELLKL